MPAPGGTPPGARASLLRLRTGQDRSGGGAREDADAGGGGGGGGGGGSGCGGDEGGGGGADTVSLASTGSEWSRLGFKFP